MKEVLILIVISGMFFLSFVIMLIAGLVRKRESIVIMSLAGKYLLFKKLSLVRACISILLVLPGACTGHYSGYIYDSDTRKPLDSVLVTDNPELSGMWPMGGTLPVGGYVLTFTDSSGFFTFTGKNRRNELAVMFTRKGYEYKSLEQGLLTGDTLYLDPGYEIRKAREEERRKHTVTIRQFPLHSGDTIFIANEEETTVYVNDPAIEPIIRRTKVYIDPDKNSGHYSRMINFRLSEWYYPVAATPKRTVPSSLPRRWVPLDMYKGVYYLYSSLENGIMRYEITDTTLISLGWIDGDYGFAYDSIIQESPGQYLIKGIYRKGFPFFNDIRIHIIDSGKGIAVFEGYENGVVQGRDLYVDAMKARNIAVIVHEYYSNIIMKPSYYPLNKTDEDKLPEKEP